MWPDERIEAYKHYVKTDIEVRKGYQNRINGLQKEIQELEEHKERKTFEIESKLFDLRDQGWELHYGEWVKTK
ncbi:hypothetical protein [Bacillus wiedmannii]|uniref:hypothetical protein n=1 Tax=Bacillus wiedmannii TaxID=1890302 RepID=UPI000AF556E3|nr:hypothetical protein [Bacillus wiedmannii]